MEKIKTGGLRRHEIIYSLDTGRLMGDPFGFVTSVSGRGEYTASWGNTADDFKGESLARESALSSLRENLKVAISP